MTYNCSSTVVAPEKASALSHNSRQKVLSVGIRGAGAAGLTCARAIQELVPDSRIELFDTRAKLPHPQRTFSYFGGAGSICPVRPKRTWPSVVLSGEKFCRTIDCHETPYSMIEGSSFYAGLFSELLPDRVAFHWGLPAVTVSPAGMCAGDVHKFFDVLIDAAFDPVAQSPLLWQSFAGVRIRTIGGEFNPNEVILMDLLRSDPGSALSFVYVLPISPTEILVEHTCFSSQVAPRDWHLAKCRAWLANRGVKRFEEIGYERGAIPMGLPAPSPVPGVLRIGSGSGAIRASTGYAFQAIQRQSLALASQLSRGDCESASLARSVRSPYPGWMRFCDRVFVSILAKAPHQGTRFFERLLRDAPAGQLIDFLSGRASFLDAIQVMWNVPKRKALGILCSQ
jgi:lycopene beta-cyclase